MVSMKKLSAIQMGARLITPDSVEQELFLQEGIISMKGYRGMDPYPLGRMRNSCLALLYIWVHARTTMRSILHLS